MVIITIGTSKKQFIIMYNNRGGVVMNLEKIGDRIYELRTNKRMSQIALGMRLGVTQETISAYENKKSYPHCITLYNYVRFFLLVRTIYLVLLMTRIIFHIMI